MNNEKFSFISQKKYTYKINKSEFIVYVFPINNLNEIETFIQKISFDNKKANCIVWGYSLWTDNDFVYKYFESIEPKKTSGFKIDYFLKIKNLYNCLIIIARYKSGPNLGIGLLSRSYFNSCLLAWDESNIKKIEFLYLYKLDFKLDNQKTIFNTISNLNFKILEIKYDQTNTLFFYGNKKIESFSNELHNSKFIKNFWA